MPICIAWANKELINKHVRRLQVWFNVFETQRYSQSFRYFKSPNGIAREFHKTRMMMTLKEKCIVNVKLKAVQLSGESGHNNIFTRPYCKGRF